MISVLDRDTLNLVQSGKVKVEVASSESLPNDDNSVHFVLSSPPYCTRIDYAVATFPELAILGYSLESDFPQLRRVLIGTSTVSRSVCSPLSEWGSCCNNFLQAVGSHKSKASKTYYYKNHVQYFDSIYKSLSEIQRVLAPKGCCVLVIQDSYYKDVYNNLPQVIVEMGESLNLYLNDRYDFSFERSMARINPNTRIYRKGYGSTESVLCFVKKRGE
ncbi:MAG: DNA methyltransferase [Candidatus Auribacterota bacterium]